MTESTATIKLTKSEIEWNIIALVWMEKSSEEFRRPQDASMFKKLREDFIKIEDDIIEGEYYALLKAPFALLYMPMLKYYRYYNDNFIN